MDAICRVVSLCTLVNVFTYATKLEAIFDNLQIDWSSTKQTIASTSAHSLGRCALDCQLLEKCGGFNAQVNDTVTDCDFKDGGHTSNDLAYTPGVAFYGTNMSMAILPHECSEAYNGTNTTSGVLLINTDRISGGNELFEVFCDMDTSDGGWTVLLRREDGSVNFDRKWEEYRTGFGQLSGEFWAGNLLMHLLTTKRTYKLRVDMVSFGGEYRYAEYDRFVVGSEADHFILTLGSYTGNATDAFGLHNGQRFTTPDVDNDEGSEYNCGARLHSGWWYKSCSTARLTGLYGEDVPESPDDVVTTGSSTMILNQGIIWQTWLGWDEHPKIAEMKIKPII